MKLLNSIKKSVVIASVGIASLVGMNSCGNCGCDTVPEGKKSYAEEYGYLSGRNGTVVFSESDTISKVLPDTIVNLEGRIVKVQPSNLTYLMSERAASHEFEYVFVNDSTGNTHLLIYPYSKGIMEGNADINYRPLKYDKIDSKLFIKTFVNDNSYSDYNANLPIEAEGIIIGEITEKVKPSDTMPSRYSDKDATITKKGITYTKNDNSIFK